MGQKKRPGSSSPGGSKSKSVPPLFGRGTLADPAIQDTLDELSAKVDELFGQLTVNEPEQAAAPEPVETAPAPVDVVVETPAPVVAEVPPAVEIAVDPDLSFSDLNELIADDKVESPLAAAAAVEAESPTALPTVEPEATPVVEVPESLKVGSIESQVMNQLDSEIDERFDSVMDEADPPPITEVPVGALPSHARPEEAVGAGGARKWLGLSLAAMLALAAAGVGWLVLRPTAETSPDGAAVASPGISWSRPKLPRVDAEAARAFEVAALEPAPDGTLVDASELPIPAAVAATPPADASWTPPPPPSSEPPPARVVREPVRKPQVAPKPVSSEPETKPEAALAPPPAPLVIAVPPKPEPGKMTVMDLSNSTPQATGHTVDIASARPVASRDPLAVPAEQATQAVPVPSPKPEPEQEREPVTTIPPYEPPVAIERLDPVVPDRTSKGGKTGTVVLKVMVNEQGRVVRVVIEKGIENPVFESAVIDAILRWKYRPAQEHGHPIRGWTTESFDYNP